GCCGGGGVPSPRPVSTGQLRPLRGLHFRPINPVVWLGALPPGGVGGLILRRASPFDGFSGYLLPASATSRAPRGSTGPTSVRVLSYWGQLLSSLLRAQRIGTELSHDVLNPARVPL